MTASSPLQVAIIMGSKSDWDDMRPASAILEEFSIAHECRVLSAHRTPGPLAEYIHDAEARGCKVFIAGAGGAAHLAGVIASHTVLPVLGVPMLSKLQGLDSLLSTVQMPRGIPVGTLAIGGSGATNAALLAISILAVSTEELREAIRAYRARQAEKILSETLPSGKMGFHS